MKSCEGFTDETLYVLGCVLGDTHRGGSPEWIQAARWVADHFDLPLIEKATRLACDPPNGDIDIVAIAFLFQARAWGRLGVKASAEVAGTGGPYAFPVPDELHDAVEELFEDIDIGD